MVLDEVGYGFGEGVTERGRNGEDRGREGKDRGGER